MTAAGSLAAQARASSSARVADDLGLERDVRWSGLLVLVCAYLLAAVARVHQLWPTVGALHPTLLSACGALVLIAINPGAGARLRASVDTPAVRWLAALLVWAGLSIPLALWPGGALDIVVNNLFKGLAMLVAIVVSVRGVRDIRRLALVFFAGVVLFALVVLSRFEVDTATGRLGKLVYYDANEFALLAACSLPFGVFAAWRYAGLVARVMACTGMIAVFITFVYCGSRGGVLALGAGLLATVFFLRAVSLRWRIAVAAIVAAAFLAGASDQFWDRMDKVESKDDYNITSPTGRVQVWKRGIGYMLDRPILGVGAGNFATAEGRLSDYAVLQRERNSGAKWSAAHNSYVQVGAELGIPGLAFYGAALFGTILALRRVVRPLQRVAIDTELMGLAYASMISLAVFAVGSAFLSLAYSDMLFALLALAMAVLTETRRRARLRGWPAR